MILSTLCSGGRTGRPFSLPSIMLPMLTAVILLFSMPAFIRAQSIILLSPNGGESFTGNSTVTVHWSAIGLAGEEVEVEYSLDGGAKWRRIGRTTADAEQIAWEVPDKPSTTVLARVATRNGGVEDQSDNVFEIKEDPLSLTLMLAPNGGEIWTEGETQQIRWQVPADAVNVTLELSTNSGLSWSEIATLPATLTSYSWTVPHLSDQEIPTAVLKVTITEAVDHFDQSDAPFTLRPKQVVALPELTLLYPNGGERFQKDSSITITWSSRNTNGPMEAQYTIDGGVTWQKIDRVDVAAQSLAWKVPGNATTNGGIRIIMGDGSAEDRSDASFTIVEPGLKPIALITPNGGEVWTEGETRTIRWQTPGDVGDALIEYSADEGITWITITTMQANRSAYDWTIPHLADTAVPGMSVRITDQANPTRFVQSATPFTVTPLPQVSLVATEGTAKEKERSNLLTILQLSSAPSAGALILTWRQQMPGRASVILHNLAGHACLETEGKEEGAASTAAEERHLSIPLGSLPSGSYLCTVRIGNTTATERIVVVR